MKINYYIARKKTMDLQTKTIDELKVIAYDLLASQEQTNRNLQAVNEMIAKKYQEAEKASTQTED